MKVNYYGNVLLFIGLILSSASVKAQENNSLKGKVRNQDGESLDEVEIHISELNKGTNTDENGNYVLDRLPEGTYEVTASGIGLEEHTHSVTLEEGKTKTLNFRLRYSATELGEVMIKGGALEAKNRTITVHSVSNADIKRLHFTKMDRVIEEVPGIEVADYNAGGVASAFTMRGFGSGGHGGDVAVQIDGVSLNESEGHDDGYADMNVIVPLNLSKMDVYKGPSSVLFGNFAQGGAVSYETRKGGEYQDLSLEGGSFDTFDGQVAIGQPFELSNGRTLKTNFSAQSMKIRGYTENSDYLKANINGRLAYEVSDNSELALTLRGHSSKWDVTGYIDEDQLNSADWNKQPTEGDDDGGDKVFASERLDFNHTFGENLKLLVFGYAVQQSFTRYSTFAGFGGQGEDYNGRKVYSTGASLNGKNQLGSVDVNWVGGFELYNEFTDKKGWSTEGRVRQEQDEEGNYRIQTTSFYAQGEFDIVDYFRPSVGVRFDDFSGTLHDRNPGESPSDRTLNNQNNFSPKLGFRSTWFHGFDFRFSASNGFTLPSGIERFDSDMDVDPAKIWQYEAGFNYDHDWVNLDLSGYILNTSSEVHEVVPGSGEFVNSGKTERKGIELGIKLFPVEGLRIDGTFAYVDTEIKNNPDGDMEGKELTGIPQTVSNLALEYTSKIGLGARYKFKDVGKYAIDDDNVDYYGGYSTSDAEVFYDIKFGNHNKARLYVQANNLFDKRYATNFSIFGGSPGAPRNFTVGVNYNL